jgi:site-specific DNA recombinase
MIPTTCALYCRVSTLKQADKFSVPTQLQRGLSFITSQKWEVKVYQEAESGSTIEDRSRFEELLKDIDGGIIQKVWVIESSRLSRNLDDAIKIQRIFSKCNVELYVNDVLTPFDSAEKLLSYHIQSAVSEYERSKTIERSIRGKSEWQDTGNMAFKIYGYSYRYAENGKKIWFIDEKEAETIRLIYKLFTGRGGSLNSIVKYLNLASIKTKTGKVWRREQIRHILNQSIYIGLSWTTKGKAIPSKVYPRIIDDKVFYKVQGIIKQKKGKIPRRRIFQMKLKEKNDICANSK